MLREQTDNRIPVLSVENLTISLKDGTPVTNSISFDIMPGEILGLVGESGCGKSVTALSLMGLLADSMEVTEGSAVFTPAAGRIATRGDGLGSIDLFSVTPKQRSRVNGSRIAMIYQEPMSALNPLQKIGKQVGEVLKLHSDLDDAAIREKVLSMLERVDLKDPERVYGSYPHQLSGGQRQRICIAMAAIAEPALLVADEPTTALDVMTQEEILSLIRRLNRKNGTAVLFISHDLSVIEKICSRVMIMYAGSAVEYGSTGDILRMPAHPYTIGLLRSIPGPDKKGSALDCIPGRVPSVHDPKEPCPFAPRCFMAKPVCTMRRPPRADFEEDHHVYCHFANERQRSSWNSP